MRSVRFNRAQFASNFKRSHHASEQTAYGAFKKALNSQISPVVAYLKAYGIPSDEMVSLLVPITPMQLAYRSVYETVGLKFAKITYKWINQAALGRKAESDSFFNEYWRRLMIAFFENESADRISEVTETTKEEVRKALAQGQLDGLTISELAALLQSASFNRRRALVIARTETTTAANYGAFIGGGISDYEVGKCWIAIKDKNTRPAHFAMDGQDVIGYNENFDVGGEAMQYPGAMGASAKNCVQCRCAMAVVPLTDEDGLPRLKRL